MKYRDDYGIPNSDAFHRTPSSIRQWDMNQEDQKGQSLLNSGPTSANVDVSEFSSRSAWALLELTSNCQLPSLSHEIPIYGYVAHQRPSVVDLLLLL